MAVNTYECFFLLDPNKASADWEGTMRQANAIIERHGGEVLVTRPWGEQKLSYNIGNFRKGTYLLTYFRSDPKNVPEIEQDCRLNELILRQMMLKLPAQIADEILAHFNGEEEGNGEAAKESTRRDDHHHHRERGGSS